MSAISRTLVVIGLVVLIAFVASEVLRRFVGPVAKLLEPPTGYYDRLVELRRAHPAFVAAVYQMHQARAAQYAAMQTATGIPPLPGSN